MLGIAGCGGEDNSPDDVAAPASTEKAENAATGAAKAKSIDNLSHAEQPGLLQELTDEPTNAPPAEKAQDEATKRNKAVAWVSDPDNPQNVLVEQRIRRELRKPTGELTAADLEKLRSLSLTLSKLNDEGLKEVAKLKQLVRLYMIRTKITDAGLREVAKLQQLTHLSLDANQITDAGLKEVA